MTQLLAIIFSSFLVGLAAGMMTSRVITETKERRFLDRMEILGIRNNELLDELKQVISFNTTLAQRNKELDDQMKRFMKEFY